MTTLCRPFALRLGLLATLLAGACDQAPDNDGAPRLAVVIVADDGRAQGLGSYDVETGELTFAPAVQDEMRERIGASGYRAIVVHDGDDADVDLDAGVAVVTAELAEGDVLELRAVGDDIGTSTMGRLELRADTEDGFRGGVTSIWKDGTITGTDDWERAT